MRPTLLLLALIVISAGCISNLNFGSVGGDSGAGIAINSLGFQPSGIKSNQLAKLTLSIENRGDYAVENDEGTIYIFDLPSDWTITDKSDMTSYTEQFSLYGIQTSAGKTRVGERKDFEWVLRAPTNLPKDEVFSYNAQARICYPYKTKIWGKLEVMSENAWLQSQPKEHEIAVQQTRGPIKVELLSKQPLMVETDVRIKIRITNVGDGVVTSNPCSLFGTGSGDEETNAIENLNKITLGESDCTLNEEIYLQKGQFKETYITCTPPALDDAPIRTDDFTMELTYNYYSDKKATISVTGTSEEAAAGIGVGGVTPVITLTDLCTKVCKANGQISTNGNAYGICATEDSSVVKYPGTTVDVLLAPLSGVSRTELETALGSGVATIKSLNLHDAKVSHLRLETLKLEQLDVVASSVQLEKKIKARTTVGIVKYICTSAGAGMKLTLDGYSKDSTCESTMASKSLSVMLDVNGAGGDKFKDNAVSGLQITSIDGRTIGEMTDGNITAITVEDFKLAPLFENTVLPSNNLETFLNFTKCDSKNVVTPYTDKVFCQCVKDIQKGYPPFDGTYSAECNTACTQKIDGKQWAKGGACNSAALAGESQCKGTTVYTYKSKMASADAACAPNVCLCYDTKTVSSTEAALLCTQ